MEAHLSKYPSMIAALSLVIHLIDYQTPCVSAEAKEKAVDWSKYLLGHAKRAYNFSGKEISICQTYLFFCYYKQIFNLDYGSGGGTRTPDTRIMIPLIKSKSPFTHSTHLSNYRDP